MTTMVQWLVVLTLTFVFVEATNIAAADLI